MGSKEHEMTDENCMIELHDPDVRAFGCAQVGDGTEGVAGGKRQAGSRVAGGAWHVRWQVADGRW